MKYFLFIFILCTTACSTTKLVESHSPYRAEQPKVQKILIIGMAPNFEIRKKFETDLQKAFIRNGVKATPSIEVMDRRLIDGESTEKQLNELEKNLLDEGYDSVLLSKVLEVENRKDLRHSLLSLRGSYRSFKSDYYSNQGLFEADTKGNEKKIYHTQTSLYTLPENRQRELLWQADIDLNNPRKLNKSINQYVTLVVSSLKWEGFFGY